MKKIRVKAVLFDLDGTLIDSVNAYLKIVEVTFQRLGLPPAQKEDVLRVMQFMKNPWESLIPPDREDRERLLEECRRIDKEVFGKVFPREIKLIDGSLEVLKELRARGLAIGLVTASWGTIGLEFIRRHGLAQYLDVIISQREVPQRKPAPDAILACLERMGYASDEAVYVGDSPVDIMAGKAAGTKTIGVLTGTSDYQTLEIQGPDIIINNVGELLHAIEPWEASSLEEKEEKACR